jgi:hypothetical protein
MANNRQQKLASEALNDRMITSQPISQFYSSFEYGVADRLWEDVESVNGSVNHIPDQSAKELSIGTASGDKQYRQSRRYIRYIPGYQLEYAFGFRFPEPTDGLRCRIGGFDEDNGVYIEQDGTDIYLVRRSKASGSVETERVHQDNWTSYSPDGMDEANTSALDLSQTQMCNMVVGWYGGIGLEVKFQVGPTTHVAHFFQGSNKRKEPIFGPPSLPIRAEIENTSSQSSSHSLILHGTKAEIIGNESFGTDPYSADLQDNFVSVTSATPILAIQPKIQFNGIENRVRIQPNTLRCLASGGNAIFRVIRGATLSNTTFSSVAPDSAVEVARAGDIGSIDKTGAREQSPIPISSGQGNASGVAEGDLERRVPISLDESGAVDAESTFIVEAQNIAGSGQSLSSIDAYCALEWDEIK